MDIHYGGKDDYRRCDHRSWRRRSRRSGAHFIMVAAAIFLSAATCSRQDVINAYKPQRRHPDLFDSKEGWRRWIHPPLLEAVDEVRATGNATLLRQLLRQEVQAGEFSGSGVYSFQLMSDEFCQKFLEELDGFYASGLPIDRPNSMNNYGSKSLQQRWRPSRFDPPP